jgi:hypothetical protein
MLDLIVSVALLSDIRTQTLVRMLDADGDSKISYEEITYDCKVTKRLFGQADVDHDSLLSAEEIEKSKIKLFRSCKKYILH